TMGSPVAAAVSGPGVEEINAIRVLSGDQAALFPWSGIGELLPAVDASSAGPEPSACAIINPDLPSSPPKYASHFPSGDHSGPDVASLSPPRRFALPVSRSRIHTCEYGLPGRSN